MRIDAALRQARAAGLDRADAEILLSAVSGQPRTRILAFPEFELDAATLARYLEACAARAQGVPVAYLLGQQEFHGLALKVSPAVLVPRPETELLVEFALRHGDDQVGLDVADLGTGSGAIALAVAAARPQWRITGVDLSAVALEVAQANALQLGLSHVQWLQGHWLQPLAGQRFDLLLSNPPYLAEHDPHLDSLRHEPRLALTSGVDGLDAVRELVSQAPAHLKAGGWLVLEHGWKQASQVCELLHAAGFTEVHSITDLAGIERIAVGQRIAGNSGTVAELSTSR